ncbi:hypothetical protein [Roseburia sp. 499]|uniref:hypothetical protein n=1 Tax=Roseburia sp. 499 TaxID=1261634 RepID=UPI0009511AE0|nr:hypothetical protein [Roseburia sp. 499]WVK70004.1 hypothetical protein BIV20_00305 [Roseburia sp. 499]
MARFCTRCGKPLEEGEVCNCGQEVTAQQAAPQQQTAPQQQAAPQAGYMPNEQQFQQTQQAVTGFLSKMFGAFINVIKHPVTAGRNMILTADWGVSIALIVLQGIFTAIFGAVAGKTAVGFLGGFSSLFGEIKIPYAKIIFGTLAISVALSFVLALLLMIGNMIIKNTLGYKEMLGAVASRSCVIVITTIIAIIVFLIHTQTGVIVWGVGNIWGFFIILQAMPLADEKMRDKLPTVMILVYLIFMLLTSLCVYKGSSLYTPSVEDDYEDYMDDLDSWFN